MKILKYLFFLILIAIIAGAIYVATKDGSYHIEESTIIKAPVSVVFDEVNNYETWENWGPWTNEDGNNVILYSTKEQGEGAGFSWKNNNSGDGTLTTTKVIPNSSIEQDLTFDSGIAESSSDIYWKFEEMEEGTKVTWGVKGNQTFMEKLAAVIDNEEVSDLIRPKLEPVLKNLGAEVLEKMEAYAISVDGTTSHGGGFYMYTTTASKFPQIQEQWVQMFSTVSQYMDTNNITKLGNPFVLYNQIDESNNSAIFSVGIFTPSLVITPNESPVLNGMMPVQKVVKTSLKGDYKYLPEAWEEANKYIQDNELQVDSTSAPFVIYKTRIDDSPNPADWYTEIFIPLLKDPVLNSIE